MAAEAVVPLFNRVAPNLPSTNLPAAPTATPGSIVSPNNNAAKLNQTAKLVGSTPVTDQESALHLLASLSPTELTSQGYNLDVLNKTAYPENNTTKNPNMGAAGNIAPYNPSLFGKQTNLIGNDPANADQMKMAKATGNDANQAFANLNATMTPTNSALYVLENALKTKSDVDGNGIGKAQVGQSDVFNKLGISGYGALTQTLNQRANEMQGQYNNYANMVQQEAGAMSDTYNGLLKNYQNTMSAYSTQAAALNAINQHAQDLQDRMKLNAQQAAAQKNQYMFELNHPKPDIQVGLDSSGNPMWTFDKNTGKTTYLDSNGNPDNSTNNNDTKITNILGFNPNQPGAVAAKYEGSGAGTVSSGAGDAGGKSYGTYQLARGNIKAFLDSSGYSKQFADLPVYSAQFDAKWKELGKNDPAFADAQQKYIGLTHYAAMNNTLEKQGLGQLEMRGPAVQEAIFSTGVQYGPGTNVIKNALKGKDVGKMSDAEIVQTIQDYKSKTVPAYFGSSSVSVQNGVTNRIKNEKLDLLKIAESSGGIIGKTASLVDGISQMLAPVIGQNVGDLLSMTNVVKENPSDQKDYSQFPKDESGFPITDQRDQIRQGLYGTDINKDALLKQQYQTLKSLTYDRNGVLRKGMTEDPINIFLSDVGYAKQHPAKAVPTAQDQDKSIQYYRDNFQKESVDGFKKNIGFVTEGTSAYSGSENVQNDVALVNAVARMIAGPDIKRDPVAIRTALSASGLSDETLKKIDNAIKPDGVLLGPTARTNIYNLLNDQYQQKLSVYRKELKQVRISAATRGLDPENTTDNSAPLISEKDYLALKQNQKDGEIVAMNLDSGDSGLIKESEYSPLLYVKLVPELTY